MTAPADVTVVWLAPADVVAGREDAARALAEWARVRGLHRSVPEEPAARGLVHVDLSAGDRAERELERAREAIASLDGDAAERALARAEAIVRDHPELPQAAWLRAEIDRAWATRYMRIEPRDEARAASAWQDAEARDGGRVPGVGEVAAPHRPKIPATIVVHGARGRAVTVRVDGVVVAASAKGGDSYPFEVPAAEHQVVVYVDGEPAFAQWVSIAGASARVDVGLGEAGACDQGAFANVTRDPERVHARGVSCDRWVAAVPGERRGSVLVARCERDACGPVLEWRVEPATGAPPQPAAAAHPAWPAWATWTLVGVGAAAAGTVAIVASGALEARPVEPRFVAGGVRTESR
jgi:hypothetical protein